MTFNVWNIVKVLGLHSINITWARMVAPKGYGIIPIMGIRNTILFQRFIFLVDRIWIVNTYSDNFFKDIFPIADWCLIS